MDALQCAYCGSAFPMGVNAMPVGMYCQGCGAPLPPELMTPSMPAPNSGLAGQRPQAGLAMNVLAAVIFILIALFAFGMLLATSHHQAGAPFFGTSETRTTSGWRFTNPDGSTLTVNNPNLSAAEARDMANAIDQPKTSAGKN